VTLQEQARALGDPTRHGIFRYLVDAGRPVDVAELTAHFGLNHNAIRQHLAKLVDAGLVVEEAVRRKGPGRPRLVYRPDPATDSRWGVVGPYERLSLLLAEVIRTGETPVEVGRRAGRRLLVDAETGDEHGARTGVRTGAETGEADAPPGAGTRRALAAGVDPLAELVDVMARQGFEPIVHQHGDEIELDPQSVCAIHLGMAQGATDASGGLVVDELIRNDPRQGHCRLRLHRTALPPPRPTKVDG
jgi:predicted ArsR family transcriptional regulator